VSGGGSRRIAEVPVVSIGDRDADRAFREMRDRVNAIIQRSFAQAIPLEVELVEGLNKIGHGIRKPVPYFMHAALPTTGIDVASAQAENPRHDLQVWVRMAGVASTRALLFLFPVVG
jgi:hypothetical protein